MNLKEFTTETLLNIVEGVNDAKEKLSKGGEVCQMLVPAFVDSSKLSLVQGHYHQNIEFDVAVTVENISSTGAKAGIKVLGINAGIGGDSALNNTTVSRIRFHVPVALSATGKK